MDTACGSLHTLLLNSKGELWSAGDNGSCQLGRAEGRETGGFDSVSRLHGIRITSVSCACGELNSFLFLSRESRIDLKTSKTNLQVAWHTMLRCQTQAISIPGDGTRAGN